MVCGLPQALWPSFAWLFDLRLPTLGARAKFRWCNIADYYDCWCPQFSSPPIGPLWGFVAWVLEGALMGPGCQWLSLLAAMSNDGPHLVGHVVPHAICQGPCSFSWHDASLSSNRWFGTRGSLCTIGTRKNKVVAAKPSPLNTYLVSNIPALFATL